MASTTAVEVSKKERKKEKKEKSEKKEKKEKKERKTKTASETPADEPEEEPPKPSKDSSKKRKRSALPEDGELEVDITAPEPLSKREQRLAKKGKLDPSTKASKAPKPTSSDSDSDEDNEGEDKDGDGDNAATKKEQKNNKKKEKSPHGVWIGNLPWTATRDTLRQFLADRAGIAGERITRVHLPAPDKSAIANMRIKPHNKGFAYVDFDGPGAVQAAIEASETLMGGRPVLIKDASNFDGRPQRQKNDEDGEGQQGKEGGLHKFSRTAAVQLGGGKEPSKRVFVGNLSFETTKDDLIAHYGKCGEVADVHIATFQDTGKCKGYAWVTFEELDAAAAAVAGYTMIPVDDDSDEEMEDAEKVDGAEKKKRKRKTRKWFVNRLDGRELRVEFAEDASTRYKKRFGKEKEGAAAGSGAEEFGEVNAPKHQPRNKGKREPRKVDARNIRPGAALANAPRASGAIVEGTGKKITFD